MVNGTPYPDAPGQSGSIKNMQALLGVGAFTFDDGGSGSGTNFGQDITSDFVHNLITSTALNMGVGGDGSLESVVANLGTYLGTFDLTALTMFRPFVPGSTDEDWADVATAVQTILDAMNLKLLMGGNEFTQWLTDIWDPNSAIWLKAKQDWADFLAGLGIGDSAAAAAVVAANKQKWVDLLASFGVGSPADVGAATAASKARWDAFLASIGLGSATAAGAQLAGNNTKISTQQAWWARLPENILISLDGMHVFYPLGSPTDTATTTVGGKRTWYAAKADMALMQGQTNSTSTPTVSFTDVGTFAQNTQATVVVNQETMVQIQADVDALKTNDTQVAGAKFLSSASGTSSTWGSPWTVTATNGNISPKTTLDLFDMNLAASSSIDLHLIGLFNTGITLTDDQTVSIVFQDAAKSMNGGTGPKTRIKGRMDAAGANYVWAEVDYTTVRVGCTLAGVDTVWATQTGVSVPAGALLQLYLGSASNHRAYQVRIGNTPLMTLVNGVGGFTDSSQMGSSYRGGGLDQTASHGTFNDLWPPARVKQFKLQDSNVQSQTYGSSARIYRASTVGVSVAKGGVQSLGSGLYDTVEYASSDIKVVSNGFALYTPGRYRITHGAKISNTTPSWTAVAAGTAYGSINQITAGPTVTSKASSWYNSSTVLGLGASFSFNAVGDGGVTELWAPAVAISGAGTYYILGDGAGEGTWAEIERIG